MKPWSRSVLLPSIFLAFSLAVGAAGDDAERHKELNAYWAEVSRSVKEGDFNGYAATVHKEGTLVSGAGKKSYPLAKALAHWKQDFLNTKAGKIKASVAFRFSQRFGDDTTAHETGIFLYSSTNAEGTVKNEYVNFEALLVKRGDWKIMMEYQKSSATREEWEKLKP